MRSEPLDFMIARTLGDIELLPLDPLPCLSLKPPTQLAVSRNEQTRINVQNDCDESIVIDVFGPPAVFSVAPAQLTLASVSASSLVVEASEPDEGQTLLLRITSGASGAEVERVITLYSE